MEVLCDLFGKSRVGYYSVDESRLHERELHENAIVSMVREIRSVAPGMGAYKLFLMLKDIFGENMPGRDRFYDLMHRRHLMLPVVKCRHTTNSNHPYRKYKNLIKGFVPTAPDQLWVSDITYIDTDCGVCYLHLLTDAYTHEIIGYVLSDTLMASHTVEALEMGISHTGAKNLEGLIHHSDRGSQYCCNKYVARLEEIKATISMTEDYCPTDNAIAERVNGIIKQEWLYRMKRPENSRQAEKLLRNIVCFYNERRPHMSNGYKTPKRMRDEWIKQSVEAQVL